MIPILRIELRNDRDVVLARQRARQIALGFGFDSQDQVRIATAVSEAAREVTQQSLGLLEFCVEALPSRELLVRITTSERGPTRAQPAALDDCGATGIIAARRVMDRYDCEASGGVVLLGKVLPRKANPFSQAMLSRLANELATGGPGDVYQEFQAQNQELLRALDEVRKQQGELAQVNAELEETNRGVVALYAELEEKAQSIERLSEQKTRFYSGMSHEFRTPINSILRLAKILLDRFDGELTEEQEKQVSLIRKSAQNLLEWVNDLLDISKAEAGKLTVQTSEFVVQEMLGTLRGMMRPLVVNPKVELIIDEPADEVVAYTDEGKLSQILRNLVSNAIKFTEQGSIRVSLAVNCLDHLVFEVQDTGIGIPSEAHKVIFEEFGQVDSPLQRRSRGTGLGLPLAKRMAELMHGALALHSEPGVGSTFTVTLPRILRPSGRLQPTATVEVESAERPLALVVDDVEADRYANKTQLTSLGFVTVEASDGHEGLAMARNCHPALIVSDLAMPRMSGFELLQALRSDPTTANIPVVIQTASRLSAEERQSLSAALAVISKEIDDEPQRLRQVLEAAGLLDLRPTVDADHA